MRNSKQRFRDVKRSRTWRADFSMCLCSKDIKQMRDATFRHSISVSETNGKTSAMQSLESICKHGHTLTEADVEEAFRSVEVARAALSAAEPERSTDDFKTTVLGGAWTMAHKGVAFDAVHGRARNAAATAFCRRKGVPQSARYDVKASGEDTCGLLARSQCRKMQHHFKLELADPIGDGKEFGDADHHAYMQPTDLLRVEGGASPPLPWPSALHTCALCFARMGCLSGVSRGKYTTGPNLRHEFLCKPG